MTPSKIILFFIIAGLVTSCKKELDVKNPNQPTPESSTTEEGIIALAQGGVYVNGFRDLKYGDGVFGLYWSGAMGFHELMADVIQAEAANAYLNQIGVPDRVILSDGTEIVNPNAPAKQKDMLRAINLNANQGQNPTYYEWAYMYNLINTCNSILEQVGNVKFTGDAVTKMNTLKTWSYWWKGYAYSRIGSIYYAGIINNKSNATNNNYVTKEQIIAEANANLDTAANLLSNIASIDDYTTVMTGVIPSFNQVGLGGVPTPDMWIRNINTLKARNILVNTPVAQMTAEQWNSILTLTNNGIQKKDNIFTGRSNETGDFLDPGSGTVAARTQSTEAGGNTYKLSERFVQDFKPGDKRLENNIEETTTWIGNSDRGNAFNTRYTLVNGGKGLAGVKVYANTDPGGEELHLAGDFEENELMKAEAKIYTGDLEGGLALIDEVRDYQGAGLAHIAGKGLTKDQAIQELHSERRVALAFRGLSFYDARRWGVTNPLTEGGGRKGAVIVKDDGSVDTNAIIEYNFLDYWDVPDNEIVYNSPAAGSAPVKNPK